MSKAGWIFRIEIVTKKPETLTKDMIAHLKKLFKDSELISEFQIDELFENIKLFEKKVELKKIG